MVRESDRLVGSYVIIEEIIMNTKFSIDYEGTIIPCIESTWDSLIAQAKKDEDCILIVRMESRNDTKLLQE